MMEFGVYHIGFMDWTCIVLCRCIIVRMDGIPDLGFFDLHGAARLARCLACVVLMLG